MIHECLVLPTGSSRWKTGEFPMTNEFNLTYRWEISNSHEIIGFPWKVSPARIGGDDADFRIWLCDSFPTPDSFQATASHSRDESVWGRRCWNGGCRAVDRREYAVNHFRGVTTLGSRRQGRGARRSRGAGRRSAL